MTDTLDEHGAGANPACLPYTIQEAAVLMGRSRAFVQQLVTTRWKGRCCRLGGKIRAGIWLIPAPLVEAWQKEHTA